MMVLEPEESREQLKTVVMRQLAAKMQQQPVLVPVPVPVPVPVRNRKMSTALMTLQSKSSFGAT
jgi:hypothetical protein